MGMTSSDAAVHVGRQKPSAQDMLDIVAWILIGQVTAHFSDRIRSSAKYLVGDDKLQLIAYRLRIVQAQIRVLTKIVNPQDDNLDHGALDILILAIMNESLDSISNEAGRVCKERNMDFAACKDALHRSWLRSCVHEKKLLEEKIKQLEKKE